MDDLRIAEAVTRICRDHSTGIIKVKAADRESKLLMDRGDLVGADLRFGYQSLAQSLLMAGRIGLKDLDAIWARGEANHLDRETLERLGLDIRRSWEIQLFAILRAVCRSGNEVEFVAGPVQPRFDRVPSERLISALRGPTSSPDLLLQPPTAGANVAPAPLPGPPMAAAGQRLPPASPELAAALAHNDNGAENSETQGAAVRPPELEDDPEFDEAALADTSDPADQARRRRQRLLKRAMENMGAPGTSRPLGSEVVTPAPSSTPSEPVSRAATAAQSADEIQLASAIEKRFQEVLAKKDYFTLLGVPLTASGEDVKNAFLQLAKTFHPDRLPASLNHLSNKITAIFEALREAYETLQVDAKRKNYLASLEEAKANSDGGAAEQAQQQAVEALRSGDVLIRKKEFEAAEQQYQRANQLDPKPIYRVAEAWAIYLDPARKSEAGRAKQMMVDALRFDPECDRAHYQLGVIARVDGAGERAEKHFREALRINPKHVEAGQELRILEMRKKGSGKRGLFR